MALDANVSIISITEGVRFNLGGQGVRTRIYKFTVGTDGPFTLEMDAGTDTKQAIETAMNAEAKRIADLRANS